MDNNDLDKIKKLISPRKQFVIEVFQTHPTFGPSFKFPSQSLTSSKYFEIVKILNPYEIIANFDIKVEFDVAALDKKDVKLRYAFSDLNFVGMRNLITDSDDDDSQTYDSDTSYI